MNTKKIAYKAYKAHYFLYGASIIALLMGIRHGAIHIGIISATMCYVGAMIVEQLILIRKEIKK